MQTPKPPPLRSFYATLTNEGSIPHKKIMVGGYLVYAPVKLKHGDGRSVAIDKKNSGHFPIPDKWEGKYIYMLPGGFEWIDESPAEGIAE
jgi:hypothetical protein